MTSDLEKQRSDIEISITMFEALKSFHSSRDGVPRHPYGSGKLNIQNSITESANLAISWLHELHDSLLLKKKLDELGRFLAHEELIPPSSDQKYYRSALIYVLNQYGLKHHEPIPSSDGRSPICAVANGIQLLKGYQELRLQNKIGSVDESQFLDDIADAIENLYMVTVLDAISKDLLVLGRHLDEKGIIQIMLGDNIDRAALDYVLKQYPSMAQSSSAIRTPQP